MKSPFEFIYRATGAMAVLCLTMIGVIILADVALRQFGGQVKSSDDFAGFALVGTALLGLAPTYRHGDHIRVGLLLDRLSGTARRALEIVALAAACAIVGWATWWIWKFVHDSYRFGEISSGLVRIHLWIPQGVMLWGLGVFFLALAEDLIRVLLGKPASYMAGHQAEGEIARFE
jgi:TRAP-type C4-dicarboxylate transport system permease small subunit